MVSPKSIFFSFQHILIYFNDELIDGFHKEYILFFTTFFSSILIMNYLMVSSKRYSFLHYIFSPILIMNYLMVSSKSYSFLYFFFLIYLNNELLDGFLKEYVLFFTFFFFSILIMKYLMVSSKSIFFSLLFFSHLF
jgi:hypothetical protein